MWIEVQPPQQPCYVDWKCYKNENSSSSIRELLFDQKAIATKLELGKYINLGGFIIRFADTKSAVKFYEEFTSARPVYIHDLNNPNPDSENYCYNTYTFKDNSTDVRFNLFQQEELNLEEICGFLKKIDDAVPQEILTIIKSNPRQLSDLERNFYHALSEVTKENFSNLLRIAEQIINQGRINDSVDGIQVNALWKLAVACKDVGLIEEWIQVLKCIEHGTNYFHKAQEELAFYFLAEFGCGQQGRQLFKEGIISASRMEDGDGIDIIKKMTLSFIGINWDQQTLGQIFPTKSFNFYDSEEHRTNYILDLSTHLKSLVEQNELLKAENLRLKQKQIIEAGNNNAETPKKKRSREEISYYFKPRPKLG